MEDDNSSQMAASGLSLNTLPEEVILHIFSFLRPEDLMFGVRATCQNFYNLSRDPSLWKRVTVTRIVEVEPGRSCFSEETYHRKLLEQECISSGGSDTMPVRTLIRSVEERGDIWPSCSVTGTIHYPKLERLILVRRNLPSLEVLVKYQRLRHLELHTSLILDNDNRQNSEGQFIIKLFENLQGLTNLQTLALHFDCSECQKNTSSISDIQASMKDYFLTGPRLRQIELECFVNDEILQAILDSCSQLEDLAMICPKFTPEAFCAAVSGKHQLLLSTLRFINCETLNDTCLKALSVAFPTIKSFRLSLTKEITNDGLGRFLEACSQLTDLKLATSSGHKILGGETSISKNLQSLGLMGITFPSPSAFQELCQYSQNLREMDLHSTNINNTEVITMADSCRLLENVTLRNCDQVTSTGVAYLMKNLPHLRKFAYIGLQSYPHLFQLEQLSPSRKRTWAGRLVLENQEGPTEDGLCSLTLLSCQELTTVGVSALAVLCPNLRELLIRTTNCVNDDIVRMILRNLPNLETLTLQSSSKNSRQNRLTGACLCHIQRWGTRLQILRLMTPYRTFSIAALVKLLAQSSTLVECVVPHHTEQNPNIPASEMVRVVKEQYDQLQRMGKKGVARLTHIAALSVDVVEIRVFRR